jgi:hypothetical protein
MIRHRYKQTRRSGRSFHVQTPENRPSLFSIAILALLAVYKFAFTGA